MIKRLQLDSHHTECQGIVQFHLLSRDEKGMKQQGLDLCGIWMASPEIFSESLRAALRPERGNSQFSDRF
jgi:hypothetical protein